MTLTLLKSAVFFIQVKATMIQTTQLHHLPKRSDLDFYFFIKKGIFRMQSRIIKEESVEKGAGIKEASARKYVSGFIMCARSEVSSILV